VSERLRGGFLRLDRVLSRMPNLTPFAEAIEQPERLVVPTISLFEVFNVDPA